ncbi:hypothetical protein [uncultured Amnibacterium sp.]|uniref:hypothetical protein n=1 Tax=uncultured Amnibacterium sp. TaxID=1631851 RepID=UPI0035CA4FDA
MAEKMGVEDRIAHFLRVSEDPAATQAERDTAGQEAERLLAKHAIDRLTLDVDGARRAEREEIERASVEVAGGKGTVALDVVAGLIAVAKALGLVAHYRDHRSDGRWTEAAPHVELVVTGFHSDLTLAVPLLESLAVQAALAVRGWWRSDPRHRLVQRWDAHLARCEFAREFGRGAAARLSAGREEAIAASGAPGTALVVASREEAVQQWVDQHLRIRRATDRRSFTGYGRAPGYAAGLRSSGSAQRAVSSG